MNSKRLLLLLINFFLCGQIMAQDTVTRPPKFELSMLFGYNTPVGFWGAEIGYRPNLFSRIFQLTTSIGVAVPEGCKISAGLNILPFKERRITPFCGGGFTFSTGAWYGAEDNTESIKVGINNYLNAYSGLKLNSKNLGANIKLILGYSFLIGNPNVTMYPGSVSSGKDWFSYYSKRLSSDLFVGFGIGATFNGKKK